MTMTFKTSAALLPIVATLAACSVEPEPTKKGSPPEPAHHYFLRDMSQSQVSDNVEIAQAIERVIGDGMKRSIRLGDSIAYYELGSLDANRMVAKVNIVTDYSLRVAAAEAKLVQAMRDSDARLKASGGDSATNLLASVEAIQPKCSNRSTVTFISDGLESGNYSAERSLAAGDAVYFGEPLSGRQLAGCRIRFVGFGITTNTAMQESQLLPSKQLAALRLGWMTYLQAAGVRAEDVEFISTL
jgi:hypothetical protein